MSWLDPNWKYHSAATHGDSQAFAERQKMRAIQVAVIAANNEWRDPAAVELDQYWERALESALAGRQANLGASYGDSTYRSDSSGLELRCTKGKQ